MSVVHRFTRSDIWGEFDCRTFDADCPYCGTPAYPVELFIGDLPDYLIFHHTCPSCEEPFDTVFGLHRIE